MSSSPHGGDTSQERFLMPGTFDQVVQKLLRRCTQPQGELDGGWDAKGGNRKNGNLSHENLPETQKVHLSRLLLRGNKVTDAGALALCSLVEASPTLAEVDLRGNSIGRKGEAALKKVTFAERTRTPSFFFLRVFRVLFLVPHRGIPL